MMRLSALATCVVPAAVAAFMLPSTLSAATIAVSDHNRLQDGGGGNPIDGEGDYAHATSNWAVGKHGDGHYYKTGYIFDLSGYGTEVANATSIEFQLDRIQNGSVQAEPNPPIDLVLVALSGTETDTLVPSDYQRAGTVVDTFAAPAVGSTLSIDVTEYVKADALAGNYTSFRLQFVDPQPADIPNTADHIGYYFDNTGEGAMLVTTGVIPEPGSLALLGLGSLGLLRRRAAAK